MKCDICGSDKETRLIDIRTMGSEDTRICLSCELVLTNLLRGMQGAAQTAMIETYKTCKKNLKTS